MRFITYWEELGQVLQKIEINNTKPDGKIASGSLFLLRRLLAEELLNLIR
jgi:hypothetical protein